MAKFEVERFKTLLKLAKCRLENLLKLHRNGSGGRRREIAALLQQGNEERARVNVKYLIRDDYLLEAYEMMLSFCDDLLQSAGLVAQQKNCDPDLIRPVKSILYACGRINVPELDRLREQLTFKYGKEFTDLSTEHARADVDPRLVVKLSIRNPDAGLANRYMAAIAESLGVDWSPPPEGGETGPAQQRQRQPPPPDLPPPYSGHLQFSEEVPDFDELTRRFQALKDLKGTE